MLRTFLAFIAVICIAEARGDAENPGPPATILEDNASELLAKLTNPTGDPGEGHVDEKVYFSGKQAIKIIPMQRFCDRITGWSYPIREQPQDGEYRYLRFAWKSDGLSGIMLQLHDDNDWHIRYTAGVDKFGWGTKYVADKPPTEWLLVTVDLFTDFGECDIHGIALTAFDGVAGYFDHIYFGRSIEDLDRINTTGIAPGSLALKQAEMEKLWRDLASTDASVSYLAFWTLAGGGRSAGDFLKIKLAPNKDEPDERDIGQWISLLGDDDFDIREQVTRRLATYRHLAEEQLRRELSGTKSAEVKTRIQAILAQPSENVVDQRLPRARRLVRFIDKLTDEADAVTNSLGSE